MAAAPLMPSFSSKRLWIVGSQAWAVHTAKRVPSANSTPTSVWDRMARLNSCSGTTPARLANAANGTPIGVDADTGELIAAELTSKDVDDGSQVGSLVEQFARSI